jgi:AcrR family transcriptional regulator
MTTPELTRRERKKDETRERIFKEAVRLFRTRGFEGTTVDEITEKADVAKGTFFNYFPRKEAVLAYLSEKRLADVEESAAAILAGNQGTRQKLLEIYASAASAYAEDRELSRYVVLELMNRAFAPSEEAGRRWHDLIVQVVQRGQAAGDLRRGVDPVRAESLLSSVYIATLYIWVTCVEGTFGLQDELRERLNLVLEGLAA